KARADTALRQAGRSADRSADSVTQRHGIRAARPDGAHDPERRRAEQKTGTMTERRFARTALAPPARAPCPSWGDARAKRQAADLILAETQLDVLLLAERVADEALVAVGAQIVTEMLGRFRQFHRIGVIVQVLKQFADRFQMVVVEISFGELGRILGWKRVDLHDV